MSVILEMPASLRQRWRRALRRQRHRQCYGWGNPGPGAHPVCAVSLLAEMLGEEGRVLLERYGLGAVAAANDQGRSFGWIAAHLDDLVGRTWPEYQDLVAERAQERRRRLFHRPFAGPLAELRRQAARARWRQPQEEEAPAQQPVYVYWR